MNKLPIVLVMYLACVAGAAEACQPNQPNQPKKVKICHHGNTIEVSSDAVGAHLKHGDYAGACVQVAVCQGDATKWLDPYQADRLVIQKKAKRGECPAKVAVCQGGVTKWLAPGEADNLVGKGKAKRGECPPKVTVCQGGVTKLLDPEQADRLVKQRKAAYGECDADADGVPNRTDKCPSTKGKPVDADGCDCSQRGDCDSDSDGVHDQDDLCPDTAAGSAADADGCDCSQRGDCDADGDGAYDQDDLCPGTEGGAEIDAGGCSCGQRGDCDADGDGVRDQDDLCPGTPPDDEVRGDGCTVVTLSASAGPDVEADPGDVVSAVGQGAALTGDPGELAYEWEQAGGEPVRFEFSSPPLTVYTEGASGDLTFRLTVSTADGSASASDEFVISLRDAAPAPVAGLSVGSWHNAALLADGTILTWGWDKYGQLGDGSLADAVDVDAGSLATLAAKADGTVWASGWIVGYDYGSEPTQVDGASGVVRVGALTTGGLLLTSGGTVLGFGSQNNNCEMGGAQHAAVSDPAPIPGLPANIVDIAAAANHSVALGADGRAWVWGWSFGCAPTVLMEGVTAIAAGDSGHCLFLKGDGTAWAVGFNLMGELGNGTRTTSYTTPTRVSGLTGVVAVAAGDRHSLFLKGDGTLWACGWATEGRLGLSDAELAAAGSDLLYGKYLAVPKRIGGISDVAMVGGGMTHTVAVKSDGTVWAWGANGYAQTGLPADGSRTPLQVDLGE